MPANGRFAESANVLLLLVLLSAWFGWNLTQVHAQESLAQERSAASESPATQEGPGPQAGGGPPSGAAEGGPPMMGPPPAVVRLGPVQVEKLQQFWEVVGRLVEVRRSIVASEVVGRVVERPVDEGDAVEAGKTVLVRIDPVWMKLQLESARAEVERAKALVVQAQANLDRSSRERQRLEELFAARSTSQKELDDARSAEQADRAQLLSQQAMVHAAEASLERALTETLRLEVTAPFDGVVVRKMIEVGQWAAQGTPLMEIISSGKIDAMIDVPERFIDMIQLGSKVDVIIEPLQLEVRGEVRAIVPDAGNAARTFPVRVSLDDQGGRLRPGMSVLARVPTALQADTLTVPRDAVLRSARGATVWMNAGGMALPAPVEVLFNHGDRLAVRLLPSHVGPPLVPGMQVVIEGAESLFPTRPLIPLP